MSILFSNAAIGKLDLPNRLIRTASHEGLADSRGRPTTEQFVFYKGFIEGGIGLVITGYAGISQAGKSALYHMTMIDSDDLIPAHRSLVKRVHGIGGKIVLQIAHCGRQSWSKETGRPLQAPSAIPFGFYRERPQEMTPEDIETVIDDFGQAARRVKAAGYDGVQIHGAHGYLLSTFLSPHANKKKPLCPSSPSGECVQKPCLKMPSLQTGRILSPWQDPSSWSRICPISSGLEKAKPPCATTVTNVWSPLTPGP